MPNAPHTPVSQVFNGLPPTEEEREASAGLTQAQYQEAVMRALRRALTPERMELILDKLAEDASMRNKKAIELVCKLVIFGTGDTVKQSDGKPPIVPREVAEEALKRMGWTPPAGRN